MSAALFSTGRSFVSLSDLRHLGRSRAADQVNALDRLVADEPGKSLRSAVTEQHDVVRLRFAALHAR